MKQGVLVTDLRGEELELLFVYPESIFVNDVPKTLARVFRVTADDAPCRSSWRFLEDLSPSPPLEEIAAVPVCFPYDNWDLLNNALRTAAAHE